VIFYTGLILQFTSGYSELFAFNHEQADREVKKTIAIIADVCNLLP
jgi:hypothetical protein